MMGCLDNIKFIKIKLEMKVQFVDQKSEKSK